MLEIWPVERKQIFEVRDTFFPKLIDNPWKAVKSTSRKLFRTTIVLKTYHFEIFEVLTSLPLYALNKNRILTLCKKLIPWPFHYLLSFQVKGKHVEPCLTHNHKNVLNHKHYKIKQTLLLEA